MTLRLATPADLLDHVGDQLGPTDAVSVDQDRINQFAEATGDHQWIHVDVERANAESPFGGPIAHGYLTLSLANLFLPELLTVENFSMGVNVGVDKVRFPAPVPAGATISATGEILSAEQIGEGIQVVVRITISVDGAAKPSCIVDTVSRFFP
ncbi:MAG: MaoC family dehydratase [Microthrixaceae bacterium]|nr:MaoC family dehydratase [Microthrixaceae bacterium]